MPIRSRLATVFSVATAVLVALGAVIFVTQLRWSLNTSVNADLRARANAIQTSIGHNNPTTELQDGSPAALAPSEPLAQILAPDGTVLAAAGTAGTRPVLTPTQIARAHRSPLRLTTRLPGFKADTRLY